MPSMLAILLLLMGTTQQTFGNGPGPLTFTIDSKLVLYEGQLDQVEIWQNEKECGKPINLNGSTQFTVDWTECPEEVKKASDLKHIEITIQYQFGPGHERMIQRVGARLADCSDDVLQKLFVGGQAKILVSKDGRNNVIEYVADKNGHPRILTFTVDSHYMLNGSMAKLTGAQIFQNYEKCKATIAPPNLNESKKFTVDWEDCPKKLNEFTDLDDIQINVYAAPLHGSGEMVFRFYLKDYSDGLLRHLFAGGEAEISIRNGNDGGKTLKEIRYVRHPNQILFAAPGLLTFNVEYEGRTVESLNEVTLEHMSKEMGGCKPSEIKGKDAQFSVDLPKCNVHDIEDLLGLNIHIKLLLQNPDNPRRSQPKRLLVPLAILKEGEKPEDVQIQQQFYNGGHAKIVFNDKDKPSLSYSRPNPPEPSSISRMEANSLMKHLSASAKEFQKLHPGASSSHSSINKSAGTVKFTIHSKKLPQENAQLESVHIYQNDDDDKKCEITTIMKESQQFTVDWNNCPEKPKTAADLREIEILVTFAGRRKLHYQFNLNEEEKYSDELLKKLFDGGEVKLVISDTCRTKHTDIEFVKESNANSRAEASGEEPPPFKRRKLMESEAAQRILAFNVDYENREGAIFDQVEIRSYAWEVDAARCKPLLYEGGKKFSVNLANCGVNTAKDLAQLMFEIRFLLDYAPGKAEVKWIKSFFSCIGQPEEKLEKFFNGGEAKLVFIDSPEEKIKAFIANGWKWEQGNPFFSLTYLSAPNKPASHQRSVTAGIQLFVESKIFEAKMKPYHYEGRDVWAPEELRVVDEQNIKLRKDGVECPVRVWENSGGQVAKFLIDWTECEPEPITSSQELDGMLLNLTYKQGKWAKELFYTFTANDPLKQIFDGHLEFRLVEYESGKVKHEQAGGWYGKMRPPM